jgi:hypothetical protein
MTATMDEIAQAQNSFKDDINAPSGLHTTR